MKTIVFERTRNKFTGMVRHLRHQMNPGMATSWDLRHQIISGMATSLPLFSLLSSPSEQLHSLYWNHSGGGEGTVLYAPCIFSLTSMHSFTSIDLFYLREADIEHVIVIVGHLHSPRINLSTNKYLSVDSAGNHLYREKNF